LYRQKAPAPCLDNAQDALLAAAFRDAEGHVRAVRRRRKPVERDGYPRPGIRVDNRPRVIPQPVSYAQNRLAADLGRHELKPVFSKPPRREDEREVSMLCDRGRELLATARAA
jgi:hypothetical protein